MKTSKKDFELFRSECQKWIDKLELSNWKVEYAHVKLDSEVLASLDSDLDGHVTLITLTTNVVDNKSGTTLEEYIRDTAKHEIIHLLLSRLSITGKTRFIDSKSYYSAEEELVRKLEKLL